MTALTDHSFGLGQQPATTAPESASDALAACRGAPRRFDALLMGHLTPPNSALDLAAKLRQSVPDVPILLATASADEDRADALAAAGISEIVRLPLVPAEIASVLARCLTVSPVSVDELRP